MPLKVKTVRWKAQRTTDHLYIREPERWGWASMFIDGSPTLKQEIERVKRQHTPRSNCVYRFVRVIQESFLLEEIGDGHAIKQFQPQPQTVSAILQRGSQIDTDIQF